MKDTNVPVHSIDCPDCIDVIEAARKKLNQEISEGKVHRAISFNKYKKCHEFEWCACSKTHDHKE